jgi:hypothetical protein
VVCFRPVRSQDNHYMPCICYQTLTLYFFPTLTGGLLPPGSQPMIWMGARGTVTPVHHDCNSLFHAHYSGRKRWTLWPPSERPKLYWKKFVYSSLPSIGRCVFMVVFMCIYLCSWRD